MQPYQTVIITAGTSTTGLAAIRLAKKVNARAIATTRTSKKKDVLLQAGADYVSDRSFPVVIDQEFQGIDKLPDALQLMASNQASGKIVVTVEL